MDTATESKAWYASKTFWASVVTAVVPLIPGVSPFIAANPEAYSAILGVVFGALRIQTAKPLVLKR